MKKYIIPIFVILIILSSCAKKKVMNDSYTDEKDLFETGVNYYESHKWSKAIDAFEKYLFSFPATNRTEMVQYYLSDCYYQMHDWTQSIVEFNYFLNNYKSPLLREECSYKMLKSYYEISPKYQMDQTITENAIASMSNFLMDFPQSDKLEEVDSLMRILLSRLEEKKYHTAHYYMKNNDYISAEVYFEEIDYNNLLDKYLDLYYYMFGLTEYKLKKTNKAKELFLHIPENSKYYNKAKSYIEKIK